jgi:hypothetical protein
MARSNRRTGFPAFTDRIANPSYCHSDGKATRPPEATAASMLRRLKHRQDELSYERCTVYLRAREELTLVGSRTTIIAARPEQARDGIPQRALGGLGVRDTGSVVFLAYWRNRCCRGENPPPSGYGAYI